MADDEIAQELAQELQPEEEAPEEQPAEQPAPEQPAPGPRMVQVGNYTVPEDEVMALVEFQNWAQSNPDKMDAFGQYLRGEAQFVRPEPDKEKAPPEVDWEVVDPNVKAAYDLQQQRLEEIQGRVSQMEAPLTAIHNDQLERVRVEAQQALDAATGKIMDRFKLSDDELDQLAEDAAKLNIVPSLRQQGMQPQAALETALETAFWQNEKWRKKIVDEEIASRDASGRRARASQVGGTHAGSDNGIDSQPQDEGGRRKAMAAEIAEALRGTP